MHRAQVGHVCHPSEFLGFQLDGAREHRDHRVAGAERARS
jgi:hypothetical protein